MRRGQCLIIALLTVLVLGSTASCGGTTKRADLEFLPAPPADAFKREPEPQVPAAARDSDAIYEGWVSDQVDWGRRTDISLWRSCRWVNTFLPAALKRDCGEAPKGTAR